MAATLEMATGFGKEIMARQIQLLFSAAPLISTPCLGMAVLGEPC
jgi:hypothetical protein